MGNSHRGFESHALRCHIVADHDDQLEAAVVWVSGTTQLDRWHHRGMSTKLRLNDELAAALREESARTGRSQQEIVREAIAVRLGLVPDETTLGEATRDGWVEAPEPFRDFEPPLTLPPARSSIDLLERDDRV
jgi:predicted DNA-binding protein